MRGWRGRQPARSRIDGDHPRKPHRPEYCEARCCPARTWTSVLERGICYPTARGISTAVADLWADIEERVKLISATGSHKGPRDHRCTRSLQTQGPLCLPKQGESKSDAIPQSEPTEESNEAQIPVAAAINPTYTTSSASEDYYQTVVINALLGILKDQSLSSQHYTVIEAIMSIFKTQGLKCVTFLPRVRECRMWMVRVSLTHVLPDHSGLCSCDT